MRTTTRIEHITGGSAGSEGPSEPQPMWRGVTNTPAGVKPIIRWLYSAFIFALLFETADIGISVKPTMIIGALLMIACFLQPQICFRRPPLPFWLFAICLYVSGIANFTTSHIVYSPESPNEVAGQLFVDIQLLILFWISYNLLRYDDVLKNALTALVVSCAILSAMCLLGVTHKTYDTGTSSQRLSAFDSDPNNLAGLLALSIVALVGLTVIPPRPVIRPKLLAIGLFVLISIMLISTGSRGALLALIVGLLAFTQRGGNFGTKVRNLFLCVGVIVFFLCLAFNSDTVRLRFERTLQNGTLAKREEIYPHAVHMFLEKPMIGWGGVTNTYEVGARLTAQGLMQPGVYSKATHNMILYLLTSSGLVGTIPFLIGIFLCIRTAWRARHGPWSILPFALAATVFVSDMSVDGHHWKQHWIIMAYALASGSPAITVLAMRKSITGSRARMGRMEREPRAIGST